LDVPKRVNSIPDWARPHNYVEWPHQEKYHRAIFTSNTAINFIKRWDQRAPLFLQIGFPGPHEPYDPPSRFLDLYKDIPMPERIYEKGELAFKPPEQQQFKAHFENNGHDNCIDFTHASRADIARMRRHYYANMTAIDEKIGQIFAALDAKGILEDSIIVFTSDHGDNLGDHDLPYKWFMYDSITNIPLMIRTSNTVGRIDEALFSQIDLGPTLLELAGIPVPSRLDGISRVSRIENGQISDTPKAVFAEENHVLMIRTEKHKLVHYIDKPYGELYDLVTDPSEIQNIFDKPECQSIHQELETCLFTWLAHSVYHNAGYKNHADPMYKVRTNDMIEYE
jgi:arylsulfatase